MTSTLDAYTKTSLLLGFVDSRVATGIAADDTLTRDTELSSALGDYTTTSGLSKLSATSFPSTLATNSEVTSYLETNNFVRTSGRSTSPGVLLGETALIETIAGSVAKNREEIIDVNTTISRSSDVTTIDTTLTDYTRK